MISGAIGTSAVSYDTAKAWFNKFTNGDIDLSNGLLEFSSEFRLTRFSSLVTRSGLLNRTGANDLDVGWHVLAIAVHLRNFIERNE